MQNKKTIFLWVLILLFSLNFLAVMESYEGIGLDLSWVWGINRLNTLPQDLYGRDVVFTYGPLGFLIKAQAYGANFFLGMFFNILKWLVMTYLVAFNTFKFNKEFYLGKIIFFLTGIFFLYQLPDDWSCALSIALLALTLWFLDPKNEVNVKILSSLMGFFSCIILFIKFNSGILTISTGILLALLFLIYEKKHLKNYALSYLLSFSIPFFIILAMYFKTLSNLINWIHSSMSIAQGFSSAMSTIGPIGFTLLAFIVITLYLYLLCEFFARDFKFFLGTLLLAPFVFFSFKHGFVRQDGHMLYFFLTIPFLVGFLSFYVKKIDYKLFLKFFIAISICCAIYPFTHNEKKHLFTSINQILGANKLYKSLLVERQGIYSPRILPENWRATIKDSTIQILPWELSYAEANNFVNWQPNPVLQLYSAYTKYLDELSANSFIKATAPEFILLEFKAIDKRNMFLDNPATWNNVLSNYSIKLKDNDKLLLKKNPKIVKKEFKAVSVQKADFKTEITIPKTTNDEYLYAQFEIKPSFLGKIVTFFFRDYPLYIEITYKNGNKVLYKVIPDTLKTPTIINYIPNDIEEFEQIIEHKNPKEIEVQKIKFLRMLKWVYKDEIIVRWSHSTLQKK